MILKDIGEFGLIERLAPQFAGLRPEGTLGIGDDCAVIPVGEECLLVTTDMLVENIHFIRSRITARDLGHKSLAVNLSDIAGMGGVPAYCFLSLALPETLEVAWIDSFIEGFRGLALSSGTFLAGGDTTRSGDAVTINVTVIGKAAPENIRYRSSARPGDYLCLTGATGESGAGLQLILNDSPAGELADYLKTRHNHPDPHLEEGRFLASHRETHAMMDVSDGIDSDLRHILKRSGTGAEIDLDHIPLSDALRQAEKEYGLDPLSLALTAGEDYCLLVSVAPHGFERIAKDYQRRFDRPLARIGTVCEGPPELRYCRGGKTTAIKNRGFDHFTA